MIAEQSAYHTPICTFVDDNPVTWVYDDLYRLTGQLKPGQVATYTLDGVGNLKTMWEGGLFPKTFTHDAADKITTMIEGVNLTTYTWTGYGALASEVTGNATTAYSYSGQEQLVGITDSAGVRSTYSFSGDGLRRTAQNGNVQPTTFVWDGSDYLLLNGPSSNMVVLTIGREIVSVGNYDLLPDSLGSVIGDIRAGQDPRVIFDYWPYGTLADAAVKPGFPFLFVGSLGYYTDSTDRDYVRARELMKSVGRWMQTDPLWPTERAFEYAHGGPTSIHDRNGLSFDDCRYDHPIRKAFGDLLQRMRSVCQARLSDIQQCWKQCGEADWKKEGECFCRHATGSAGYGIRITCRKEAFCNIYVRDCMGTERGSWRSDCSISICDSWCERLDPNRNWERDLMHEIMHCCGASHDSRHRDCQAEPTCLEDCLRSVIGWPPRH